MASIPAREILAFAEEQRQEMIAFLMKGGLTQMVFALRVLRVFEAPPAVTPVVLINSDEEIGSEESTPYIRRLARSADRAYVLEPALGRSGKLKTRRRGAGRFVVQVTGKSAHAGLDPGAGAGAILELSHVILEQRLGIFLSAPVA